MVTIQHANFVTSFCIPYVHPTVCRATEHELRIRTETRFNCDAFVVEVASESLQRCAMKRVDETNRATIGGDEDGFAVPAEFEPGPVAFLFL